MNNSIFFSFILAAFSVSSLYADFVYIVGENSENQGIYWNIVPPSDPTGAFALDQGDFYSAEANAVAISPNRTTFIVGAMDDGDDNTLAVYWTVSPAGVASDYIPLTEVTGNYESEAEEIAFNNNGVAYIVGKENDSNACFWTVTPDGERSDPILLDTGHYANAVGFTSTNIGYIAGTDQMNNVCYWVVATDNSVTGPFFLTNGDQGGGAGVNAIAVTPNDVTYIVGINKQGYACYWTISPQGVASTDNLLINQINSMATDVAFFTTGVGIIVGQGPGNTSGYWLVDVNGITSDFTLLNNGDGAGSSAYGVAYDSTGTAYIVGLDNSNQAVYWTLPTAEEPADVYHILPEGSGALAKDIAIYTLPNPPKNLSGRFVKNNFGWEYEYAAVLKWTASDTANVVRYNIYKNDIKIASVSGTTLQYANHNQDKHLKAIYAVTAEDEFGHESVPTIITVN